MINLGCTGSRNGMLPVQRENVEDYFKEINKHIGIRNFRQGCCVGVDEELTLITYRLAYWIIGYPPIDRTHLSTRAFELSSETFKPRGYLIRNKAIVDDCELLLAVPHTMEPYPRSGTWSTIKYARQTHRRLKIFYPDGSVVDE